MSFRKVQQNDVVNRNTLARNGTLAVPTTTSWTRNPTWAALPSITSSDEKVVGLYAVDVDSAFIAFTCNTSSGTYHVDWGDGTTDDYSSATQANHTYTFTDSALANTDGPVTFTDSGDLVSRTAHGYTNGMTISFATITSTTGISVGQSYYVINANANDFQLSSTPGGSAIALTTDGSGTILPYKQALVTVTCNTGGATLSTVNLNVKNSTSGLNAYVTGWLDVAISMSGSSLTIGGSTVYNGRMQQCNILRSGVTNATSLFASMSQLASVPTLSTGTLTNCSSMFNACKQLTTVPLFNTASVTNMGSMFSNCTSLVTVPLFNTASVTNMSSMFSACNALVTVPLFNTALVTDMSSMFLRCSMLTSVPLFNTASVTNMNTMFSQCPALTSVPLFNTAACTSMSGTFNACTSLVTVPLFNTALVTDMSNMFNNALTSFGSALVTVPLFNTASVTNMGNMFNNCFSLTTVPLFNTASVTNMSSMFNNCYSLMYVPPFNTVACTNFSSMFQACISLVTIPALDCSHATSSSGYTSMFSSDAGLAQINCTGHKYTFTVAGCKLSSTALNTLYTNLGTVTGQTITVSSNYGTSGDDPTIATAKGWTVTGS